MSGTRVGQCLTVAAAVLVLLVPGCFNRPPQHGTALLLAVETTKAQTDQERQQLLEATVQVLQKRVDRFGAHFTIHATGTNGIELRFGDLSDQGLRALRETVQLPGLLEFCLVEQGSSLLSAESGEPKHRVASFKRKLPDGRTLDESLSIKLTPEMVGGVKRALVTRGSLGQPEICFTLNEEATKRFAQVTRDNVGRQLAILLDGEVQTAPVIRSPIEQGQGVIEGSFDRDESFRLACVLEAPLPAPVHIIKEEPF